MIWQKNSNCGKILTFNCQQMDDFVTSMVQHLSNDTKINKRSSNKEQPEQKGINQFSQCSYQCFVSFGWNVFSNIVQHCVSWQQFMVKLKKRRQKKKNTLNETYCDKWICNVCSFYFFIKMFEIESNFRVFIKHSYGCLDIVFFWTMPSIFNQLC